MAKIIVREDDTLVCEECYFDEGEPRPIHREAHVFIDRGECDCGTLVIAGKLVDITDQK